jgi:hypothetical protein
MTPEFGSITIGVSVLCSAAAKGVAEWRKIPPEEGVALTICAQMGVGGKGATQKAITHVEPLTLRFIDVLLFCEF